MDNSLLRSDLSLAKNDVLDIAISYFIPLGLVPFSGCLSV